MRDVGHSEQERTGLVDEGEAVEGAHDAAIGGGHHTLRLVALPDERHKQRRVLVHLPPRGAARRHGCLLLHRGLDAALQVIRQI